MNPKIKKIIDNIASKIIEQNNPLKIFLFGSAVNQSGQDPNDLDFLIIKESALRRDKRDIEIRENLSDIVYPMDIFVYTPQEYEKFKNLPFSFINKIVNSGKLLYESK